MLRPISSHYRLSIHFLPIEIRSVYFFLLAFCVFVFDIFDSITFLFEYGFFNILLIEQYLVFFKQEFFHFLFEYSLLLIWLGFFLILFKSILQIE